MRNIERATRGEPEKIYDTPQVLPLQQLFNLSDEEVEFKSMTGDLLKSLSILA